MSTKVLVFAEEKDVYAKWGREDCVELMLEGVSSFIGNLKAENLK